MNPTSASDLSPKLPKKALHLMSDEAFKTYLAGCTINGRALYWHESNRITRLREKALLKAKAARLTRPLYIVKPDEHGNGGWCGSTTLDVVAGAKLFSIDPVRAYLGGSYEPSWGSKIRACKTEDPNDALYLWDHENEHWTDGSGTLLMGAEGKREEAARNRRNAKRAALFRSARAKLSPAERAVLGL